MRKLRPGQTVMIEGTHTPGAHIFRLLADTARARGLKVKGFHPERALDARARALAKVIDAEKSRQSMPEIFQLANRDITDAALESIDAATRAKKRSAAREHGRPSLAWMSENEAEKLILLDYEVMTDFLVMRAMRFRPALIIVGGQHAMDAHPYLMKAGYSNLTPRGIRRIYAEVLRVRRETHPAYEKMREKFVTHRRKLLQRALPQPETAGKKAGKRK
ncbi:MAG: hypothetical protein V1787_00550 [Candidatus Micrarchaeota archaeon]